MEKKIQSDFLFAQPNFLSGSARVLDLFGEFDAYNESNSTQEADGKAIAADWLVTGQDLQDAIDNVDAVSAR